MPDLSNENRRELAAQLIAYAELRLKDIAERVGVTYQTIYNWRKEEEFDLLVKGFAEDRRQEIRRIGISVIENRVAALQDRWERMKLIIAERANAPEMQAVPGGPSGLLARDVKSIGAGANAERVEVFEFDAALMKELREHERQAAIELGQWGEPDAGAGDSETFIRPMKGGDVRNKSDVIPDPDGKPGNIPAE